MKSLDPLLASLSLSLSLSLRRFIDYTVVNEIDHPLRIPRAIASSFLLPRTLRTFSLWHVLAGRQVLSLRQVYSNGRYSGCR